jgi:DNA polymerase (family 10)
MSKTTESNGLNVKLIADEVVRVLTPLCENILVVGSIRRLKEEPNDVDIVLITNEKEKIHIELLKMGTKLSGGDKKEAWEVNGVKAELYYATEDTWGAFVLMYTGSKEYNISMRAKAKSMGYSLSQYGLFNADKIRLASQTEEDIFTSLAMEYVEPEER